MAGHPKAPGEKEHWRELRELLEELLEILKAPRLDMIRFGKAYAAVARGVRDAVSSEGRTSMRFEAVVRALDLRTKKSVLQKFLDDSDPD